jgi:hypothetical protein
LVDELYAPRLAAGARRWIRSFRDAFRRRYDHDPPTDPRNRSAGRGIWRADRAGGRLRRVLCRPLLAALGTVTAASAFKRCSCPPWPSSPWPAPAAWRCSSDAAGTGGHARPENDRSTCPTRCCDTPRSVSRGPRVAVIRPEPIRPPDGAGCGGQRVEIGWQRSEVLHVVRLVAAYRPDRDHLATLVAPLQTIPLVRSILEHIANRSRRPVGPAPSRAECWSGV